MSTEAPSLGDDPARVRLREGVRGARYGEVLLVRGGLMGFAATVYNTLGLNDCPDALWSRLDAAAIKREHRARAVVLNGPRRFLMDAIAIVDPGEEVVAFGGLEMRRLATVRIPLRAMVGGLRRRPYTEHAVRRTTAYVWNAGREVFELVAPDGATYVMQSVSLAVDPSQGEASLPGLGARLGLPAGWRYRARALGDGLVLRVAGEARVIQDELDNSYQRVAAATA